MDLMSIKSTLQSNYTSLRNRMTTSSTMGKLLQDLTPLLKGVIDTFFTSCLGLIQVMIVLTILLLDLLIAIQFGLVMWLESLVKKITPDGKKE
tara:strand:- start:15 stop:293 length:279 start_codon:yes stop_codon:yes gene_type:complete